MKREILRRSIASDLNYPSIAVADLAGSQVVTRRVTSVAQEDGLRTYKVSVQAPAGYNVTVSPSTLTLARGQTASYQVTIVNQTAPIGQWRFGSLTWTSTPGQGGYKARSPIAVRASQFNAPALVSGSGEVGSAEFPVFFGYTGTYSATAHGLVPATVTSDTVPQDVNQSFNPSDVPAGADLHTFTLSGAAVFRIAMPPGSAEAGADIDIYVYNSSNMQVASSTAGGTDELITINNPVDGDWKVYVHGWLAPGGSSEYTMYSWVISATPGGSLTIVSAPTSAVIGTVGTVEVSWTGATDGQWHFGAVSHVGPTGVLSRTLVEVDNR